MKKIIIGVAALLTLAGCGAILEALVTDPLFSVQEPLYDGQIFRLTRLGACIYRWEVNKSDIAKITYLDKDGKKVSDPEDSERGNARVSVKLKSQEYTKLIISATNPEETDITKDPTEKETYIQPWCIALYGDDLQKAVTTPTYTPGDILYVSMSQADNTGKASKRVIGNDEKNGSDSNGIIIGFKDSKYDHTNLVWSVTGVADANLTKMNTLLIIDTKGATSAIKIDAYINPEQSSELDGFTRVTHSLTINKK